MPIIVFNLHEEGALESIMRGEKCGTLVTDDAS
jgi:uridylate kinase